MRQYTFTVLLLALFIMNKVDSLPDRRISIEAARRLDTRVPEEAEQQKAEWLKAANEIARLMLENEEFREEEENLAVPPPVDDFTKIPFKCPYFPPSATVPTSVHALRPGDIKVVAALGDSITAGNGIRSTTGLGTWMVANRGESFSVGGERSLDEGSLTLLNIIRKFNPEVEGGSYCARRTVHEYAGYNVAVPGSISRVLEPQAKDLVLKLAKDDSTYYDSWKVITLLIGGNDMCRHCNKTYNITAESYRVGIEMALDIFHKHLPRAFVNLQIMTEVGFVRDVYDQGDRARCRVFQSLACPCGLNETRNETKKIQMDMYHQLVDLVDSGKYDDREDFAVVIQPFLRDQEPFTNPDGTIDTSFFAPDCFHPGVKMHQAFALMLWNTMLTPVQDKVFEWEESLGTDFKCPTEANPYFFTKKNS